MTKEKEKGREELLKRVRSLAEQQGVKPISNTDELRGDFWPAEDVADDFLAWLHSVRQEDAVKVRGE